VACYLATSINQLTHSLQRLGGKKVLQAVAVVTQ